MEAPALAEKFTMYQEMRSYVRCLLECLNEKVSYTIVLYDSYFR